MIGNELKAYDGLTSRQQLNLFRNLYYNDGNATEYGIIANAINDYFTADVVPKSEVDRLQAEVKVLTKNSITSKYPCCVSCSKGLILTKSLEEYDKLLADIANEVAREIFEEIEKIIQYSYEVDALGEWHDETLLLGGISELKEKYTEG